VETSHRTEVDLGQLSIGQHQNVAGVWVGVEHPDLRRG
jgi:hypothetical protein